MDRREERISWPLWHLWTWKERNWVGFGARPGNVWRPRDVIIMIVLFTKFTRVYYWWRFLGRLCFHTIRAELMQQKRTPGSAHLNPHTPRNLCNSRNLRQLHDSRDWPHPWPIPIRFKGWWKPGQQMGLQSLRHNTSLNVVFLSCEPLWTTTRVRVSWWRKNMKEWRSESNSDSIAPTV